MIDIPVPHLTTVPSGPLHPLETAILSQVNTIEAWFSAQWQKVPPPLTSSVDLRHAGFKLAPVDTNLFPAGFNNLNRDFLPLCVQALQSVLGDAGKPYTNILLLPESHTRNQYYLQSLQVIYKIVSQAGFTVRIGSLDPDLTEPQIVTTGEGELSIAPLYRKNNRLHLNDFDPDLVLLNNDLSKGVPSILAGLDQPIQPSAQLGWSTRLKSTHFDFFNKITQEFAQLINLDPWLITPIFTAVEGVDFMAQEGLETLAEKTDQMLGEIREHYDRYQIRKKPFVVVKADNGTYGMGVMMVHNSQELLNLNRKQRTRMAASKGSQKVDKVIIQEGVYTFETMPDGSVAEPVVYMIGPFVIGGFYRVHESRGKNENLNAPGMHFAPLAFAKDCNKPCQDLAIEDCSNRFYVYGVVARLAALAAGYEAAQVKGIL